MDQLSAEYLSQQPGSELVINKLTEVVLVELVRINFGRQEAGGFIRALTDRQISQALAKIHGEPNRTWTLESLAREIGMSRAAFAKRFKELVGRPMFEYLTATRMNHAKELLEETKLPIYQVATRVGYDSDLAFVKTFKKLVGTTPLRYRKSSGQRETPTPI